MNVVGVIKRKEFNLYFFVILLVSLKYINKVSLICYNLKAIIINYIFILLIKIKIS